MKRTLSKECKKKIGETVYLKGWMNQLRKLGKINFLVLRDRKGFIQIVVEDEKELDKLAGLYVGTVLAVEGKVVETDQHELGVEINEPKLTVISPVKSVPPIEYNKSELRAELNTILNKRVLTLRNRKLMAMFKIQAEIKTAFREYLRNNDFVEFSSPKLLAEPSEGGSEFFELPYFERKAYLAQSPQFYKQIMVGVYERVFEIAPVFRAEKHNTSRHLNEYVSMDLEFGFIENWSEVLQVADGVIKHIIEHVWKTTEEELNMWDAKKPLTITETPSLKVSEIHDLFYKETGKDYRKEDDLAPEEERFICEYSARKWKSDLVFATHYNWGKRPFYTKRTKGSEKETNSADLLFRGVEIMTGGQREENYEVLVKQANEKGVTIKNIEGYLEAFKYGMPPEGGFAMGSERITEKMLGISNIKLATLFPRDIDRLTP